MGIARYRRVKNVIASASLFTFKRGYSVTVAQRLPNPRLRVQFLLAPPLIAVWIYFAVMMTAGSGS